MPPSPWITSAHVLAARTAFNPVLSLSKYETVEALLPSCLLAVAVCPACLVKCLRGQETILRRKAPHNMRGQLSAGPFILDVLDPNFYLPSSSLIERFWGVGFWYLFCSITIHFGGNIGLLGAILSWPEFDIYLIF